MKRIQHTQSQPMVSRRTLFTLSIPALAAAGFLAKPAKAAISARTVLTGPTTFHVSPFGDDAADGIAAPWLTLQHAWNTLRASYDLAGHNVTVQLEPGEYWGGMTGTGALVGQAGAGSVIFQGDVANPWPYYVNPSASNPFSASHGANFTVRGMVLNAPNADLIAVGQGGIIEVGGNIVFGNAGGQVHMTAAFGGTIIVRRPGYQITGSGQCHISAGSGGRFYYATDGQPGLLSVQNNHWPTFTAAFAAAVDCGVINCQAVAWSGGAYGPTYLVKSNGVITTGNPNPNYFPGMVAGTENTGGKYL